MSTPERNELAIPDPTPVKFADADHQKLTIETASAFMRLMYQDARGLFGYYLARAMTGVEPEPPSRRQRQAAPDLHGG